MFDWMRNSGMTSNNEAATIEQTTQIVNRSGRRSPRRCHQPCSQTSSQWANSITATPFSRDSGTGGST